jgi:hypothetical protein
VLCRSKQRNPPELAKRPGSGREDKSSFVLIQGFLCLAGMAGTSGPSAGRLALVIRLTSNNETGSVFKGILIVSSDYSEARSIPTPRGGITVEYSAPFGERSLCVQRSRRRAGADFPPRSVHLMVIFAACASPEIGLVQTSASPDLLSRNVRQSDLPGF